MSYIIAIKTAVLLFPILALFFTIPFILIQYHKYGSINKFRVVIVYSFILYLLTIYFLVILPLPRPEDVVFKENMIRLNLFGFVNDFIRESSFVLQNPKTYLNAMMEPCFYTVALNIFMTIPFGMYLRYYFKLNLKQVIIYSFLLSLFFEITQLTRLYFIYAYQYRVFDVDDLLTNTFGGILGYLILGLINRFLPTRDEIDEKSFEDGKKVSGLRRITLFCFDAVIYFLICFHVKVLINVNYILLITFTIYYILLPFWLHGQTIGGKFLSVKIVYKKYGMVKDLFRILFLYCYYIVIPFLWLKFSIFLKWFWNLEVREAILLLFMAFFILLLYFFIHLFYLVKKGSIYYDKIFQERFESTIGIDIDLEGGE